MAPAPSMASQASVSKPQAVPQAEVPPTQASASATQTTFNAVPNRAQTSNRVPFVVLPMTVQVELLNLVKASYYFLIVGFD